MRARPSSSSRWKTASCGCSARSGEVIYDLRLISLEGGEDLKGEIWEMIDLVIRDRIDEYLPEDGDPDDWELAGLKKRLLMDFFVMVDGLPDEEDPDHEFDREDVTEMALEAARATMHRKLEGFGDLAEKVMSYVLLTVIDDKWKDHLYDLDHLKASIGFRGWGQKDPLVEYKKEAFDMFVDLMTDLRSTVTQNFFRAQIGVPQQQRPAPRMTLSGPSEPGSGTSTAGRAATPAAPARPRVDPTGIAARARTDTEPGPDVSQLSTNRGETDQGKSEPVTVPDEPGRNDPCPCGSGKKYKKCHGRV
ncbi:MAG: SEC-C metal-binding domain-containing protein [Gemmatimonadota bacterium]